MSEWLAMKGTQTTNVGEDVEKRECLYTAVDKTFIYCCGNSVFFQVLQKTENRITWVVPYIWKNKNKNTNSKIYAPQCTLCKIAKIRKQPKCPTTDEWIKMWTIYTMDYYSAIKKKNTTWMDNMQQHATCSNMNGFGGYYT